MHMEIHADDIDPDEGNMGDDDLNLVTDFEMMQSYEAVMGAGVGDDDSAGGGVAKGEQTMAEKALDSVCASVLRTELPDDERRDIIENAPTVLAMIVDVMYKKKVESARPSPAAPPVVRGYKQRLAALYPSVDKATEFEQKYTVLIAAAFVAMLARILPASVIAVVPGLPSYDMAAINAHFASILQSTEPLLEGMGIVKVLGDLQTQFIVRTNPLYKARLDAAPQKTPPATADAAAAKPNRFRPPLAPVTDRMARSNKVSSYLQGLYSQFTKVRPNSVNASRKPLPLNSCCIEKVRPGMRYSESQTEEVKKQRVAVESGRQLSTLSAPSIKMYVARQARVDYFGSKTLRFAKPRYISLSQTLNVESRDDGRLGLESMLTALAADHPFLASDAVFSSGDINTISEKLDELFSEQWDLVSSVRSAKGLPDLKTVRSYVIDLRVPRASYPRLLQGLDHFLECDLRRAIGRAWYGKRQALPGSVPMWAELILRNTVQRLRPVHVKETDITNTLYAYNYIIVKLMLLLMWSLTVPAGSDLSGRVELAEPEDMINSIREMFLTRHQDDVHRIGEFFAGLWSMYIASISTSLTTDDVLKQHAEGLREEDKVRKMGIKANMTAEERDIYDGLKAAGLTHLYKETPMDIDAIDQLEAAAPDARVDIDGVNQNEFADVDMDAANVVAGYIDTDFSGENGDDYGDD
jgi:hypothetical protein